MEENPFPELKIDSTDFLDTLGGRSKCPQCKRSRKYYCYNCYVPLPEIKDKVPKVKLPIKIDIIKHPSEVDGKSTAVHAAVIAPDDVTIYTYPCIPDYEDKNKVLLVFPGETSVTLADLAEKWGLNTSPTTTEEVPSNAYSSRSAGKRKASSDSKDNGLESSAVEKAPRLESMENNREESNILHSSRTSQNKSMNENSHDKKEIDSLEKASSTKQNSENDEICSDAGSQLGAKEKNDREISSKADCSVPEKVQQLVPKCQLERVVFVDSTWNQTKTICGDERLKGLQCIELKTRETKFWRHQKDIPNTYLSTVEAIYYFLRDYHEQFVQSDYRGEYDNLLFFFTFMYKKIRTLYDGGEELQAYKERKGK